MGGQLFKPILREFNGLLGERALLLDISSSHHLLKVGFCPYSGLSEEYSPKEVPVRINPFLHLVNWQIGIQRSQVFDLRPHILNSKLWPLSRDHSGIDLIPRKVLLTVLHNLLDEIQRAYLDIRQPYAHCDRKRVD